MSHVQFQLLIEIGAKPSPSFKNSVWGEKYCLYVIEEFEGEYVRQPRLQNKFPWVLSENIGVTASMHNLLDLKLD